MRSLQLFLIALMVISEAFKPFQQLSLIRRHDRAILMSLYDNMDDDEVESFKRITSNYLVNKFKDCQGDDCRLFCTKNEVQVLLRAILPPITEEELQAEEKNILKGIADLDSIDVDEFLQAATQNSYWEKAGPLVVKELIFLDCLNAFYFEKRNMLDNDDYNELKEMLTWEGSAAATMKGSEAQFVLAVAASRRGQPTISDEAYEKLKVCTSINII